MAKFKVFVDRAGIASMVANNKALDGFIRDIANDVRAEMEATASAAEKGAGGEIDGYAAAGFSVVKKSGDRRPTYLVKSNADSETMLRAHFYTQKNFGTGHLRAALYKVLGVTSRKATNPWGDKPKQSKVKK